MTIDPSDLLFSFALGNHGELYVNCPPGRESVLPGVLRIVADALEAGETNLDVLQVPVEEIDRWRANQPPSVDG